MLRRWGVVLVVIAALTVWGLAAIADEDDDAMSTGGLRLESLQNNDGGWDWPLDDGNPGSVSPLNTIGPIGMGLARSYWSGGEAAYKAALQDTGELLLTKTNNFSPSDGYLATILDSIFGGSTYRDHVKTYFYDPLAAGTYDKSGAGTLYDTASYVDLVRTSRANQGIANMAAWDVGMGVIGAAACGADTTAWVAGTKGEIDELDSSGYYDVIGLAGALYALAFVGEEFDPTAGEHAAASCLADLGAILASYQIDGGGFAWNANYVIPSDGNETVQETAYAILALNALGRVEFLDEIQGAADWLVSFELGTGGWANYDGDSENNEVTGEALWGIHTVYLDDVWVDGSGDDFGFGYGAIPFATLPEAIANIEGLNGVVHVGNGVFEVGPGTYDVRLIVEGSATIEGAGMDATTLQVTPYTPDMDWTTAVVKVDGNSPGLPGDVTISDLTLQGIPDEDNSWFIVTTDHIPAGVTLTFRDARITGSYLYGWWDYHSHGNLLFENNVVDDVEYGMMLEGWDTGSVTIRDSEFSQGAGYFGYPAGLFLFTYSGLDCDNAYRIEGNVITNADPGYGIAVYGGYLGETTAKFTDVTITSNDIRGIGYYAVYLRNLPEGGDPADGGVHDALITFNDLSDNIRGVYVRDDNPGTIVQYNDLSGNSEYGVLNTGTPIVDATLNWWGDAGGPSGEGDGAGSAVSTNVIYSPWLGTDPDGDSGTPGVQVTGPATIIVAPEGPEPTGGYLNTAIAGANSPELPYGDLIEVRHGTYDASEPVTAAVTLVSEVGSAEHTTLNGNISLTANDIILGMMRQGFTISDNVTVGSGADASTIFVNWNDIYGIVTNDGSGVLDATYNFWDYDGPDTVGRVRVNPILPVPTDQLIGYVDDYGLTVMQAITFARLQLQGRPVSWSEVAAQVSSEFGLAPDDVMALIREYGLGAVKRALRVADTLEEFMLQLVGYGKGGVGGGAGGAAGGSGPETYVIGQIVPLFIELTDPFTGEIVDDAVVSYSVTRILPDGTSEFVAFGAMSFDPDAGGYSYAYDTTGMEPGAYEIYLGVSDGTSVHYEIEVTE
jgi:hypothetical protein